MVDGRADPGLLPWPFTAVPRTDALHRLVGALVDRAFLDGTDHEVVLSTPPECFDASGTDCLRPVRVARHGRVVFGDGGERRASTCCRYVAPEAKIDVHLVCGCRDAGDPIGAVMANLASVHIVGYAPTARYAPARAAGSVHRRRLARRDAALVPRASRTRAERGIEAGGDRKRCRWRGLLAPDQIHVRPHADVVLPSG